MATIDYLSTDESFSYKIDQLLEKKKGQLRWKRAFDISFSMMGLLVLSPLFLIVMGIIKLDSSGPIFFTQKRIGKDAKPFYILKFRTMVVDAQKLGMQITVGRDKRITKVGHVLRKYKIDELPQLVNVLKGDMSFVGPRPEVSKYVKLYSPKERNVLKIRPGITDLASIEYRDENNILSQAEHPEAMYINHIMVKKLELNYIYLRKISLLYDIKLIAITCMKVFGSKRGQA